MKINYFYKMLIAGFVTGILFHIFILLICKSVGFTNYNIGAIFSGDICAFFLGLIGYHSINE